MAVIRTLRLQDFRCFRSLALELPAEGVLLTGDNAQGKTSVLEAVCVLLRLHSPRTHRMAALARFGSGGFGVAGEAWGAERRVRHAAGGPDLAVEGERRAGPGDYLRDGGLVVWMGNEDLALVRGPGEGRRRYLDFLGGQLDPEYRRALARYRRALRAKNLLLKDPRPRLAEIEAYEEILIESGTRIASVRADLALALAPFAAEAQREVGGRDEALALRHLPGGGPDLREAFARAREREIRLRQCVVGPHRDDLALDLHGRPASDFASEGQQRTLALALKLAQGRLLAERGGRTPVYLLDDIFGELDPGRRNALMRHLPAAAQKWITTTHLDWLRDDPALAGLRRLRLREGEVTG